MNNDTTNKQITESLKLSVIDWVKRIIKINVIYTNEKPNGQRIIRIDIPIITGYVVITILLGNIQVYQGYIEI